MKFPIKLIEDFGGYQKDDIVLVDYEVQAYLFDNGMCEEVEDEELDEFFLKEFHNFRDFHYPINKENKKEDINHE